MGRALSPRTRAAEHERSDGAGAGTGGRPFHAAARGRAAQSRTRPARRARGVRRAGLRRADGGRGAPRTGGRRHGLPAFPQQGRAGAPDSRGGDRPADRAGAVRAGPGGRAVVGALPLPAHLGGVGRGPAAAAAGAARRGGARTRPPTGHPAAAAARRGSRSSGRESASPTSGSLGGRSAGEDGLGDDPGAVELLEVVGQLVDRAREAGELRGDVTVADVLLVIATAAPALPDPAQQAAASARLLDILLEGLRSRPGVRPGSDAGAPRGRPPSARPPVGRRARHPAVRGGTEGHARPSGDTGRPGGRAWTPSPWGHVTAGGSGKCARTSGWSRLRGSSRVALWHVGPVFGSEVSTGASAMSGDGSRKSRPTVSPPRSKEGGGTVLPGPWPPTSADAGAPRSPPRRPSGPRTRSRPQREGRARAAPMLRPLRRAT